MSTLNKTALLLCVAAPLALAGCSSTKSSAPSPTPTTPTTPGTPGTPTARETKAFTSWNASGQRSNVNLSTSGTSHELSYSNALTTTQTAASISALIGKDAAGDVDSVKLAKLGLGTSTDFLTLDSTNATANSSGANVLVTSNDGTKRVIAGNNNANGMQYQTYGAWIDTGATNQTGGFSTGAAYNTAANVAFDAAAAEVYTGKAVGYLKDTTATRTYAADASVSIATGGQASTFNTTNSTLDGVAALNYNISGTSLTTAQTGFTAVATNQGNTITGVVNGSFFGAARQEMGGSFVLDNANAGAPATITLSGGYGARKP